MTSKGQREENISTSSKPLCASDTAQCEDAATAAAAVGGSVTGVCKLTFNLLEELQGDSSLEPGEVITPPHGAMKEADSNRDVSVSTKKTLFKDTLSKVMKKKSAAPNGDSDNDDDDAAMRAKSAKTAAADEDDDSEGLYSGSDSTGDEEKMNKPDVARYEMHPKPVSQPIVENFQSMPPYKNFMHMPRFMPRVPMPPLRGGMRPGFFHHRAPGFHMHPRAYGPNLVPRHMLRLKTPPPPRGHSPIRTSKTDSQRIKSTSPTPPTLNNARVHGTRTPRRQLSPVNRETEPVRTPKEHLFWTTVGKHDVKWSINSKLRNRIDDMCRDYYNESKSKSKKVNSSQSRKPDKSKKTEKTTKKPHTEKSAEKSIDRAQEIEATDPEKSINGKSKDMRKMFDIFAESPPRTKETAVESDAKQTTTPLLLNIKQEKIDPTDLQSTASVVPTVKQYPKSPPRSTTPPLADLYENKTKNPLIRAIAVQSRIDKLLQENDLELEELLATKESLLRKTREHRKLSSAERHHKRIQIKQEHSKERSKTETKSKTEERLSTSNNSNNLMNERHRLPATSVTVQPTQRFKRESSPWEEEELPHSTQQHIKINLSPALDTAAKSKLNPFKQTQTVLGENACLSVDKTKHTKYSTNDSLERAIKVEHRRPNGYIKVEKLEQEEKPKTYVNKSETLRQPCEDESTSDSASKSTNDSKAAPSPDTDDYIDNWENDDSTATCDDTQAKLYRNDTSNSNQLWNAKSTPLPKAVVPRSNTPETTPPPSAAAMQNKPIIDMQEMYDKFLKSIKMNAESEGEVLAVAASTASGATESSESSNASSSNSSNNSNLREDNSNETQENKVMPTAAGEESITQASVDSQETIKKSSEQDAQTAKNNVSRDLKRLKTLEGNLARIQMMRENYDSGDELCEELVKMESLFLAEKSAIMAKYRKTDLKLSDTKTTKKAATVVTLDNQQQDASLSQSPQLPELLEANNIFDANREAIKLKLSPLKLTRKAAIFERDETESATQTTQTERDFTENLVKPKPAKEIAIVKPMMDTKLKRGTTSPTPIVPRRARQRSRSHSRSRRRSLSRSRLKSSPSRSISPRRRRAYSPVPRSHSRGKRYHVGLRGRSRSRSRSFSPKRSLSRSRSRSRSDSRRRRLKFSRKRGSYSPPPLGPRSPPMVSRRRSYSRERYSRSPLPFKPPSPPMRRSCSSSPSRSRSPHSNSPYTQYFMANHSQGEAAYYYANMPHSEISMDAHMSLMLNEMQDSSADRNLDIGYEDYTGYTSYMDGGYLASEDGGYYTQQYMPQQAGMYAQMGNAATEFGYYYNEFGELLQSSSSSAEPSSVAVVANNSVLKELPKAPAMAVQKVPAVAVQMAPAVAVQMAPAVAVPMSPSVAVQKGNVLEIVPSGELPTTGAASTILAGAATGSINTLIAAATTSMQSAAALSEAKAAAKAAKLARREAKQQRILERKKAAEAAAAAEKSSGKKQVNFEDRIKTNHESEDEDEKIIERAVQRAIKRHRARVEKLAKRASNKTAKAQQAAASGMPPLPPPPIKPDGPAPQQLKYLLKKPTIRYYHFDSQMGIMYFSYARVPKPLRFNPKCMPMFFNASKVPLPMSVPGAASLHSTAASEGGAVPKEIVIPTHPPPPLGQPFDTQLPPPNVGGPTQLPPPHMRYIGMRMNNFVSLRAPQPDFVQSPQPIPVVGMSYQPSTLHDESTYAMSPSTAMPAAETVVGAQTTRQHFNVTPIPSITEITPVEITPAAVAAALAADIAPTDEQQDEESSESQPATTALPANVTLIPTT